MTLVFGLLAILTVIGVGCLLEWAGVCDDAAVTNADQPIPYALTDKGWGR